MALDNEAIVEQIASARVSPSCPSLQSLAAQAAALSEIFELTIQQLLTEITNIINTGGGGTTPVYIIRALVNVVGGVVGTSTTFTFDGATDLFSATGISSGVTSGTAQNIEGRAFVDNEPVNLTSFNGTIWLADKLATNTIKAQVDQAGGVVTGDATFLFKNAAAITGAIPPGGTGTAQNVPATAYAPDEWVVLIQADDGTWAVLQDDDDNSGGGGGGGDTIQTIYGLLASDLLPSSATCVVNVTSYTGDNPGSAVSASNPLDSIATGSTRLFLGNQGGFCTATNFGSGWVLTGVQVPRLLPLA